MNEHDGLCPECNGHGWYVTPHIWYPEEDDWVEVYCFACDGTGKIATIPTEEEAAQSAYQAIGGTLHTERHEGRDVLTLPWPIRPR